MSNESARSKILLVAIRRADPAKDDAVLGDLYALQRDRPRGSSRVELNRRSETKHFIDGGRHEARALSQAFHLVGMGHEFDGGVPNQRRCRLVPRNQQQHQHREHFFVAQF